MIEVLDILWQFATRSWQLWGWIAFICAPVGFAVVAAWDFNDWRNSR
jgi:hypothetical protein